MLIWQPGVHRCGQSGGVHRWAAAGRWFIRRGQVGWDKFTLSHPSNPDFHQYYMIKSVFVNRWNRHKVFFLCCGYTGITGKFMTVVWLVKYMATISLTSIHNSVFFFIIQGKMDKIDVDKAVEFVLSCMNFDGGFGCRPGSESHAGQVSLVMSRDS